MKKIINWIKRLFRNKYIYCCPHGDCLWRVNPAKWKVELSGNTPNDWWDVTSTWTIKDLYYFKNCEITYKQAKERFPNATF